MSDISTVTAKRVIFIYGGVCCLVIKRKVDGPKGKVMISIVENNQYLDQKLCMVVYLSF